MNTHKCIRCVWSDRVSSNKLFCMLPSCIIKSIKVKELNEEKDSKVEVRVISISSNKRKGRKSNVSKKIKKTVQTSRMSKVNRRKLL